MPTRTLYSRSKYGDWEQKATGTPVAMFRSFIVTALKLANKIIIYHGESDGDISQ